MPPQIVHVKDSSKIANALSNEKCQRIMDYLSKHEDATESKLAQTLGIPASTVHYNMKLLVETKLVLGNEYTYSPKGKEVTHYQLNKNPIVIIQEESKFDFLKALTPAAAIAAGIGFLYTILKPTPVLMQAAQESTMMADVGQVALKAAAAPMPQAVTSPNVLPWFLAGVAVTFLIAALFFAISKR